MLLDSGTVECLEKGARRCANFNPLASERATEVTATGSQLTRLTRQLKEATREDAKANAYIIFVLNRLRALGSFEEITDAFDQDKVDLEVIQRQDLDFAG
jgi:hypothetical protein